LQLILSVKKYAIVEPCKLAVYQKARIAIFERCGFAVAGSILVD